jgi:hypothetical protein
MFIEKVKNLPLSRKVLKQAPGTNHDWAGYRTLMQDFQDEVERAVSD